MIFDNLIKTNKDAFIAKVQKVADYLGVKPEWLMFVMWFESYHSFDPAKTNSIGATGLIQFMPATAKGLGTTTDALRKMSNVDQLTYVQKHLSRFKGQYPNFVDLYCAIFWPAAVGKPDTYKIGNAIVAKENPLFDAIKDGQIYKSEIRSALLAQIPKAYLPYFS